LFVVMTEPEMSGKTVTRDQIAALAMLLLAAFGGVYAMLAREDNGPSAPRERDFEDRFVTVVPHVVAAAAVFVDPKGAPTRLSDFRGRVILVNLWASWCAPCVRELPALDRLQARLGGADFEVVAVNLDRKPEEGRRFLRARGIKRLAFYHDDKLALFQALNPQGLPLSLLIDREGRVLGRLEGAAAWDSPAARKVIKEAIAEKPGGSAMPAH
jgi:thiol-disulfide isomerase/thioredoxin